MLTGFMQQHNICVDITTVCSPVTTSAISARNNIPLAEEGTFSLTTDMQCFIAGFFGLCVNLIPNYLHIIKYFMTSEISYLMIFKGIQLISRGIRDEI